MNTEGNHTIADFCRTYNVGRTTVYRLVQEGKLRIIKIGRASRITKADAQSWAENLPAIGWEARDD